MVSEVIDTHPNIEICSNCGDAFKNIALHWEKHPLCSAPNFSPWEKAIATGLLLYRGYLAPPENDGNNALVCFLEREALATELFDIYGNLALKTVYVTGEEFFGRPIRRSYAVFLRSHPYLTTLADRWGTGDEKSAPDPSEISDTAEATFEFLYEVVGSRGFDGNDWVVFDCTQLDAYPHHLIKLLDDYEPFLSSPDHNRVVLRETDAFLDDIESVSVGLVGAESLP